MSSPNRTRSLGAEWSPRVVFVVLDQLAQRAEEGDTPSGSNPAMRPSCVRSAAGTIVTRIVWARAVRFSSLTRLSPAARRALDQSLRFTALKNVAQGEAVERR
jgi:hypothetical protein